MTDKQVDDICISIITAGFAAFHPVAGIAVFVFLVVSHNMKKESAEPEVPGEQP